MLSTFDVTDTLDDTNTGSLRWAIQQANIAGGEIDFHISGSGVHTINISSPLPALSAAGTTVDATTQSGYAAAGHPLVVIDGTNAGSTTDGLQLTSAGQTVKGLSIDHFGDAGVFVGNGGSSATITDDYLGLDALGTTAAGNHYGILLRSLANNCDILSNVISGNVENPTIFLSGSGIFIDGDDPTTNTVQNTLIQGNLIGTTADGKTALANQESGIDDLNSVGTHVGGTTAAERNVVSGNYTGITLYAGTGMVIEGNYIGPDITGETALGNNSGQTTFPAEGIMLRGPSDLRIGGTSPGAGNVISGNGAGGIDTFASDTSGVTVQGNFIGVDATGTLAMGNGGNGIALDGETNVVIGGSTPGARNVIANNTGTGIDAFGSAVNWTIQGNYVGTDVTATKIMGNGNYGIRTGSPNNVLIGGTAAGEGNVIVNNTESGIETLFTSTGTTTIQGNFIGTDPTQTIAMGNGGPGIRVPIQNAMIGGTAPGAGNVIANNGAIDFLAQSGVWVTGSGDSILSNSIYNNHQLGIDLFAGAGNNNQPAPVLTSVTTAGGSTTIVGTLNAAADTTFTIQFFSNTSADPSGAYEGQTYFGSTSVTTDGTGAATINVTIPVATSSGQKITATATDPNGNTSEFSAATTDTPPLADLALTTSVSASTIYVGQNVTYTLTVTNNGPSDATGVVLTDVLPAALSFVSATTTQGSTPIDASGTVTADIGTILSGSTATITITVLATAAAPPSVSSAVDVTTTAQDNNPENNTATLVTNVTPLINIAITGSGNPTTIVAGQNLTYTFTVKNFGPSPATNVVFTQNLPSGVTFDSVTPSVGTASESGGVVTAELGTLASGAAETVTVVVTAGSAVPPSMSSTASLTAAETDSNPANNTATVTTDVTPSADLAVGIIADPSQVKVGQIFSYTVTVTNSGPNTATHVELIQNLPNGAAFVSAIQSTGVLNKVGRVLTLDIAGLASGASATLIVSLTAGPDDAPSMTTTASLTADQADPNLSNNTASLTTTVIPIIDLAVLVTPSPSPVDAGQNLTYTVLVENDGLSAATGVVLTNLLPSSVTFVSATSNTGDAPAFANGKVTAAIGNLASNADALITIVVATTGASASSVTDTATAEGNETDSKPENNTSSVDTTVTPSADLDIEGLSTDEPYVDVGTTATYRIVVQNHGPSPAVGVVLTQDLPAGFTFVSGTPSVGTVSATGSAVTADLGTLASGASATLIVVATPANGAIGDRRSTVSVSSTTLDPVAVNNSGSISIQVDPSADLALTLTPSADSVLQGAGLTYTLSVKNQGPSNATGVVLVDTLPAGAALVSATSDKGDTPIDSEGSIVSEIGNLAAGATATVTIVITPDERMTTVTNSARIEANESDLVGGNNSASATTAIEPVADIAVAITPQAGNAVTGEPFVYTLKVTNDGPSGATDVELTAQLPSSLNFASADSKFSAVTVNNGVITMNVGALDAGAAQSYSLTVTPVLVERATVIVNGTSSEADSKTANNTAEAVTNIVTPTGTFAFSAAGYAVDETAGVALITVERLDGYQGKVSVHFHAGAGSAKPGVDFQTVDETLVFGQGETSKTLAIPVLADPNDNHNETVVLKLDSPTGGAKLGNPATSLLTIRNLDPVTVGPKVTDIRLVGPSRFITEIDVVMTGHLDPATLTSLGFTVTDVGTFGGGVVAATVSYNAGLGIVAITPEVPLKAGRFYEIRVAGTGANAVEDIAGNPLNSTLGITAGSDAVETFARGTKLKYADENGARVTLQIRNGVIDVDRDASGHVTRVQLLGVIPRRTTFFGTVRGGETTIDNILGMGPFGTVKRNLSIPPFQVTNMPYQFGNNVDPPAVDTLLPSIRRFSSLHALKMVMQRKLR